MIEKRCFQTMHDPVRQDSMLTSSGKGEDCYRTLSYLELMAVDEQCDGLLHVCHGRGGQQLSDHCQGLRQHFDKVHGSLQGRNYGPGLLQVAVNAAFCNLTLCRKAPCCSFALHKLLLFCYMTCVC